MLDEGFSVEHPKKKMRRKWIRYERKIPTCYGILTGTPYTIHVGKENN